MDIFDTSNMPHLQSLKIAVISDIILTIPSNFKLSSTISTINLERTNLATLEYLNYFKEHHPDINIDLGHHLNNYLKQFTQDPNGPCTFNFESMKLTQVPELIKNYPNISSFKINGKIELSSFDYINPEHIVEFHADCYLQEIPTIVSKMKNLKILRLGSFYGGTNSIQQVTSWIGNLEYLEEIALVGNNVTRIAEEIANCKSLKNVYLHYDDGDRVHSNPICKNSYEIKKLQSLLPNTNIVFD
jgi:Leucine-rich repeat (LRR) protein